MTEFEVALTEPSGRSEMLTKWVGAGLGFKLIDPGGYGAVNFDLDRKVDAPDFPDGSEIAVYNANTGEQVCGGRFVNPGRDTSGGERWQITCQGEGLAHMMERTEPYHLIDTRLSPWFQGFQNSSRINWAEGSNPADEGLAGLKLDISSATVAVGRSSSINYYDMAQYGQEIGGFRYAHQQGRATTSNRMRSLIIDTGALQTEHSDQGWETGLRTITRQVTDHWTADRVVQQLILRYTRQTSTLTVHESDEWAHVSSPRVTALRYDRNGARIVASFAYDAEYVLGHQAVIDCWARFCPRFDLPNARIDPTTFEHRQLVWPDGINPYGVFEHLLQAEPGFTWAVWEKQDNDLYRAEWRALDLDVRYELDATRDGYSEGGAAYKRFAKVTAVSENTEGRYRATSADEFDPVLAPLGIAPSDTIKVDEKLEDDNFAGDDFRYARAMTHLQGSKLRASSAQALVTRKVYDRHLARHVNPEDMLPGYLAVVAGARAARDTLNTGESDGAAVMRVVSNDHTVEAGASRLELNSYTLTEARAIADRMGR